MADGQKPPTPLTLPGEIQSLKELWSKMHGLKQNVLTRAERYAAWTVPSVAPSDDRDGQEQIKGNVPSGARLVTHLSNRIVEVMFPTDRPFFTLPLNRKAKRGLRAENKNLSEEDFSKLLLSISKVTAEVEIDAMRDLDMTQYRPVAVRAIMHAIVTGNVILHRMPDQARILYGIQDFCVTRNMRGALTSVLLRDTKLRSALSEEDRLLLATEAKGTKAATDASVEIFTYYYRQDGRWFRLQGIDDVLAPGTDTTYPDTDFPILDITWNLSRGETYARGLVEDHTVLFHNIDVSVESIIDLIGIAADIKFLVDPSSVLDIEELNNSARGTYHLGRDGDITSPEFKHRLELQVIIDQVKTWERELAQVFLMNSGTVRDAERVTAEEIRFFARELESAFGGLYSQLALQWQQKEADFLIRNIDLGDYKLEHFDVVVSTGLESLSREGQLDNLRMAIADLAMLESVPEDVRGTIDVRAFAEFVFTNRGVNLAQFVMSQEQMQAQRDQQIAEQERLMKAQGQTDVASKVAANASKGEN